MTPLTGQRIQAEFSWQRLGKVATDRGMSERSKGGSTGPGQHEGRHPWRAVWRPWCHP